MNDAEETLPKLPRNQKMYIEVIFHLINNRVDLYGNGSLFLKCTFGDEGEPITDIMLYRIKFNERTQEMLKPDKIKIEPVAIQKLGEKESMKRNVIIRTC
jgi:hypothetical protein